jgi:hypothetical protein
MMNVFTPRPCGSARKIRRAGGRAGNWRRHCDLAQRRRGAELFAMKEHFLGRCLLMNVFTLRPAPLREQYVVLGVVRLTGVGTVISRRGAEALSFLQ